MSVAFGTSGLRGPAAGFSPDLCHAYVAAFLERCATQAAGRTVFIAGDFRDSTPVVAASCLAAARASGWTPVWAGNVPTPALAAYALDRAAPAIMITGSHIPETYNGIKFYRPDGEFLKEDEAPVRERAEAILASGATVTPETPGPADPQIAEAYVARYRNAFGASALAGLKVGVDLHSAVGRDLTVAILETLGATVTAFRRAERFIAVDTEALDPADVARSAEMIRTHGLVAVVSTDGDGDRPLVIDETGRQINGDVLGVLTARRLGIATVVTPLSSTSAIEQSGWFASVERTRIGSPYVVAGMASADRHPVAGFEANGGFLLEDDLALAAGPLKRLPTRDAILPMVAVLAEAAASGQPLSSIAASLPARFMMADRVKEVPAADGKTFLAEMAESRAARAAFDPRIADPADINLLDGVRMTLSSGSTVHFRQSGNAPEMRCYVETGNQTETLALLGDMMKRLSVRFGKA